MLPVILSTALALAPRSPLPPIAVELPAAAQGAPAAPLVLGLKFDDALRVRVGPEPVKGASIGARWPGVRSVILAVSHARRSRQGGSARRQRAADAADAGDGY